MPAFFMTLNKVLQMQQKLGTFLMLQFISNMAIFLQHLTKVSQMWLKFYNNNNNLLGLKLGTPRATHRQDNPQGTQVVHAYIFLWYLIKVPQMWHKFDTFLMLQMYLKYGIFVWHLIKVPQIWKFFVIIIKKIWLDWN